MSSPTLPPDCQHSKAQPGKLRRLGHDLKGAGEGFGFPELSILGAKLELAAKARNAEQVATHTATMERYLGRLQVRFE